ncbi:rod-binding protein [Ruegeria pomeroyi]|uniref:Flagellar protein FlgJ, putative n=2 Tax=Ruegeria pomeroyi TaxID=89184 RepID=Q5LMV1_RUEPO|nr:rod-binding protein [Ruegeria pomeroyi]HCE69812.1 flagellar biosynthesis protein FlgJ [Ruegeria sp.]AAV96687.1 flagellar protein FlgJ, putative [Ruegeria pomeroyi DSS-3]NVK98733.1 rod-binding protein [Ruegeria pomeroyi]NVL02610.1 rod-binding protein [Ruegeria pomeroyi]QWV10225.1 rod-binding protein [Ruegeria pomeroyi]
MDISTTVPIEPRSGKATSPDSALRAVAVELEATFLAEMLKASGLGKARDAFGGGAGEEQFSSFLVRQQADQLAKSGGIGLAESLFNALKESQNGQ